MILQHGESIEDIAQAHELAGRAAAAGHAPARWLSAATVDRLLMYQGKPQRYGTQSVSDGTRWRLWDVEEATTDAERAALDVPPLHQLEAEVAEHTEGLPQPGRPGGAMAAGGAQALAGSRRGKPAAGLRRPTERATPSLTGTVLVQAQSVRPGFAGTGFSLWCRAWCSRVFRRRRADGWLGWPAGRRFTFGRAVRCWL